MHSRHTKPLIISFSGIDGAGKSTQIEMLQRALSEGGVRVSRLAFWNNGAMLSGVREFASHAIFRGEKGIGSKGKPVRRRDKNIQAWPLTIVRFFLYCLDGLRLNMLVSRVRHSRAEVIIFDRYIYDELANLPLASPVAQTYCSWLLRWVQHPDVAYLLDADVDSARERKPEYELDFLHQNRLAYLKLSSWIEKMHVILPGSESEVQRQVIRNLIERLPRIGEHGQVVEFQA